MADTTLRDLQRERWRTILLKQGIPDYDLEETLTIVELVCSAIDGEQGQDIEQVYGFGDYSRGLATIATCAVYKYIVSIQ